MSTFQFKHFSIHQQNTALKVGTDAMLLGSLCEWEKPKRLLDIGTGTAVLVLMCSQRFSFEQIVALEIEPNAAKEAELNAKNSPFPSPITVVLSSVQDYQPEQLFDAIISNPPFFENSLKNENEQLGLARHTDALSYSDLVSNISRLLSENGRAWMILPNSSEDTLAELAKQNKLFINRLIRLEGKPGKHVRTIFSLSKQEQEMIVSRFTIRDETGNYTSEYKVVTREFHDREL